MNDRLFVLKGLHEAKCLLIDRVPERYRGKALQAVMDAIVMLDAYVIPVDKLKKLPVHSIVWEEFWNGEKAEPDHRITPMILGADRYLYDDEGGIPVDEVEEMDTENGNRRRYWTNKPTMEMRKAFEWK